MSDPYLPPEVALEIGKQEQAEISVAKKATASLNTKDKKGSDVSDATWIEKPGDAAFRGPLGLMCAAIGPHSEADPAAILSQSLLAFGNIIGRGPHFVAESSKHSLNMFVVLVGVTSKGRKGSALAQVRSRYEYIDPEWANHRILSGLSSGEGLIWAVRDRIEKLEPVKSEGIVVAYEHTIIDEGVSDKRLVVVEEEFASTLSVMTRPGNTLSALIRRAWDTGNLESLTKNSPARATGAHISIIGHITLYELLQSLTQTEQGNGFANRFLWLAVRRSKFLPEGGNLDNFELLPLLDELEQAVNFARNVGEMKRDDDARQLWHEVYEELSTGHPGLLGAITSRAEAQTMRLACLYALLDCSDVVRRTHLESALELWKFCERSARFIFGESLGDPVADEILKLLREAGASGLTRTELNNYFSNHKTPAIKQALRTLAGSGLVVSVKEQTGGRPVERFFALSNVAK